ncbi:MAG: hypothetical protein IV100_35015 [Myxococcales bacterium]|nr:hypothetical protein [Myxococcales bacterium]
MPTIPIGLMVRGPAARRREEAVRRLRESGVLRTESLIDVLLTVAPEPVLGEADATAMLTEKTPTPATEGEIPSYLPFPGSRPRSSAASPSGAVSRTGPKSTS